jgi:hypothetical protein
MLLLLLLRVGRKSVRGRHGGRMVWGVMRVRIRHVMMMRRWWHRHDRSIMIPVRSSMVRVMMVLMMVMVRREWWRRRRWWKRYLWFDCLVLLPDGFGLDRDNNTLGSGLGGFSESTFLLAFTASPLTKTSRQTLSHEFLIRGKVRRSHGFFQ